MTDRPPLGRILRAWNRGEGMVLFGVAVVVGVVLAAYAWLDPLLWQAAAVLAFLVLAVGLLLGLRRTRSVYELQTTLQRDLVQGGQLDIAVDEHDSATASPVLSALAAYVRNDRHNAALDATILRMGSPSGRDVLALMASQGRMRWAEIRQIADVPPGTRIIGRRLEVLMALEAGATLRLVRVVAMQELYPDDRPLAYRLFRALLAMHGPKVVGREHGSMLLGLAVEFGHFALARELMQEVVVSTDRTAFHGADLCNPYIDPDAVGGGKWLELFNRSLVTQGVAPVHVEDGRGETPFDGLATLELVPVTDGPLVTVVITTWRPDACLEPAVRSIINQTWKSLEILLIDDASPEEFVPLLEQTAKLDPRIRLIRQPRNGGTYLARNRGLKEARGEYFTVHDSDDWAHPQRIEFQLKAMLDDESLVSTASHCLRADDNLCFNQPGSQPRRENASSLLFRLAPVRERVGFYDASRKGADTEFSLRIVGAFGEAGHRLLPAPLAIVRRRHGSLSREEFKGGWRHPSRSAYRRAYEAWHAEAAKNDDWYMDENAEQRFRRPIRFEVDPQAPRVKARQAIDVVFAGDFRASAPVDWRLVDEASILLAAGLKVGLLHMESCWNLSRLAVEAFHPDIEQLLARPGMHEVLYTDSTEIGTLVVKDASVLQFVQSRPSPLRIGEVRVISNGVWSRRYSFNDCSHNAFVMFGQVADWCLAAGVGASALQPPPKPFSGIWPTVLDVDDWRAPRSSGARQRPRVGLIMAARSSALAETPELRRACLGPPEFEIVLREGEPHSSAHSLKAEFGDEVLFEDAFARSRRLYLASVDFYLHHPQDMPESGDEAMWIAEALASGCIAVLDPRWKRTFGDAAVYCRGRDVPATLVQLHADQARCLALRARADHWVRTRLDPGALVQAFGLAPPK